MGEGTLAFLRQRLVLITDPRAYIDHCVPLIVQAMANIRFTRELGIQTGQNSKGDRCLRRC